MGGIYHQAGCCCGQPCSQAACSTSDQPAPLVVVDSGECECVGSVGGPYVFAGYVPYEPAAWVWYGGWCDWETGSDFNLNISCHADGNWRVWIAAYAGAEDLIFEGVVSADDLFCVDGQFVGTFSIPGQDRCLGQTATITF